MMHAWLYICNLHVMLVRHLFLKLFVVTFLHSNIIFVVQILTNLIKKPNDVSGFLCTLCIMPRSRTGPGNESHQNKAARLGFAFLQFCALFQVNIILKNI